MSCEEHKSILISGTEVSISGVVCADCGVEMPSEYKTLGEIKLLRVAVEKLVAFIENLGPIKFYEAPEESVVPLSCTATSDGELKVDEWVDGKACVNQFIDAEKCLSGYNKTSICSRDFCPELPAGKEE